MQALSLNGEWQLTYQTIGNPDEKWGRWISALVPGDIHLDLMRAGLIGEPLVGMNSTRNRWIEEKEWIYKRIFDVSESFFGQKMELVCDGLDLTAEIWLNGKKVGSANNMFRQYRFDVTHLVKTGSNEVIIRLDVGFEAVRGVPTEKFEKAWGRDEPRRPWMRKAQQAFYWDVAPRLVTCGIWRDVTLLSFDELVLRDAHVTSSFDDSKALVKVGVEVEALSAVKDQMHIEVRIQDAETDLLRRFPLELKPGMTESEFSLELASPKLWWPNGSGEAHLYQVSIRLINPQNGHCYGEKTLRHGIRSVTILQEPLNEKEKTFTFVVNGVKVFCKGGNWVPSDAIYARIHREKEYQLLKYAQGANFNMIRVWGGGVYPDTFFYEICDELGIMVWQDFMYACAYYPDDEPAFCEEARLEAEWIVRKFRNHASLALWCGNNENYWMHNRVNPQGTFYGLKIYSQILPEAVRLFDGVTYYHPSSPYPGSAEGQENEGDQHIWSYTLGWYELTKRSDYWDYPEEDRASVMRIWDMAEHNHKFASEFGIWSPSNPASLQKYMGEYPAVVTGEVYQHHRNHFEADFILEMLRRYYKKRDEYTFGEFVIAGQMVQSEVIKHTLEEFRSRMFVCSGTLFWEYNDTWGHVGYAPVDYYLNVKPIYFYMQRAFAPLHVVFKENAAEMWLLNDTNARHEVTLEYGFQTFSGEIISSMRKTVLIEAASSLKVDDLREQKALVVDPRSAFAYVKMFNQDGELLDRNRRFLVPLQELDMPADSMDVEISQVDASVWIVNVSAKNFCWMVKIDADENLRCSDNAFDLWPGESKTVTVTTGQVYPGLKLRVENINQFINQ